MNDFPPATKGISTKSSSTSQSSYPPPAPSTPCEAPRTNEALRRQVPAASSDLHGDPWPPSPSSERKVQTRNPPVNEPENRIQAQPSTIQEESQSLLAVSSSPSFLAVDRPAAPASSTKSPHSGFPPLLLSKLPAQQLANIPENIIIPTIPGRENSLSEKPPSISPISSPLEPDDSVKATEIDNRNNQEQEVKDDPKIQNSSLTSGLLPPSCTAGYSTPLTHLSSTRLSSAGEHKENISFHSKNGVNVKDGHEIVEGGCVDTEGDLSNYHPINPPTTQHDNIRTTGNIKPSTENIRLTSDHQISPSASASILIENLQASSVAHDEVEQANAYHGQKHSSSSPNDQHQRRNVDDSSESQKDASIHGQPEEGSCQLKTNNEKDRCQQIGGDSTAADDLTIPHTQKRRGKNEDPTAPVLPPHEDSHICTTTYTPKRIPKSKSSDGSNSSPTNGSRTPSSPPIQTLPPARNYSLNRISTLDDPNQGSLSASNIKSDPVIHHNAFVNIIGGQPVVGNQKKNLRFSDLSDPETLKSVKERRASGNSGPVTFSVERKISAGIAAGVLPPIGLTRTYQAVVAGAIQQTPISANTVNSQIMPIASDFGASQIYPITAQPPLPLQKSNAMENRNHSTFDRGLISNRPKQLSRGSSMDRTMMSGFVARGTRKFSDRSLKSNPHHPPPLQQHSSTSSVMSPSSLTNSASKFSIVGNGSKGHGSIGEVTELEFQGAIYPGGPPSNRMQVIPQLHKFPVTDANANADDTQPMVEGSNEVFVTSSESYLCSNVQDICNNNHHHSTHVNVSVSSSVFPGGVDKSNKPFIGGGGGGVLGRRRGLPQYHQQQHQQQHVILPANAAQIAMMKKQQMIRSMNPRKISSPSRLLSSGSLPLSAGLGVAGGSTQRESCSTPTGNTSAPISGGGGPFAVDQVGLIMSPNQSTASSPKFRHGPYAAPFHSITPPQSGSSLRRLHSSGSQTADAMSIEVVDEMLTCNVCNETVARCSVLQNACKCTPVWCKKCLHSHLDKQINELRKVQPECSQCSAVLPLGVLRECLEVEGNEADRATMSKYKDNCFNYNLTKHSDAIKICPSCGFMSLNEGETVRCGAKDCGVEFCGHCGIPHEPNSTEGLFPHCPLLKQQSDGPKGVLRGTSQGSVDNNNDGTKSNRNEGGVVSSPSTSQQGSAVAGNDPDQQLHQAPSSSAALTPAGAGATAVDILPKKKQQLMSLLPKVGKDRPAEGGKTKKSRHESCPSCQSESKFAENVIGLSRQCQECGHCFCKSCRRPLNSFHTLSCIIRNADYLLPRAPCVKPSVRAIKVPSFKAVALWLTVFLMMAIWVPLVAIFTPVTWFCSEFHLCIYKMNTTKNQIFRFFFWLLSILSLVCVIVSVPLYLVFIVLMGLFWPILGDRGVGWLVLIADMAIVAGNPYINFSMVRRIQW